VNRAKYLWFAAFTAVFAVMAAFVFWGTWSLDFVPVMPDCPTTHAAGWWINVSGFLRGWLQTGIFAPDDLRHLTGSPYFWQELQYVIPLYLAGLAVAYYCNGRGLSSLASYGAGLLLAFSGYWMTLFSAGHLGWFYWMTYGVFAFGLADRAVRKNKLKNWLLLGAVVGWAGYHQQDLWLLFTVFTGVYFVWCCVRERKFPNGKGVAAAALAFLVIGAPGFRAAIGAKEGRVQQMAQAAGKDGKSAKSAAADAPKTEAEKKAEREEKWVFVTNWSLPADETAEFFVSRVNGDTSCPFVLSLGSRYASGVKPYTGALGRPLNAKQGNYRQHSLYVGWVTCLLALAGIVLGFRRKEVWFFAVAALVCWGLSLGRDFEPLYRIVFALPVGDLIRCPVKWHHLTELCLAFLAAFGLEGVLNLLRTRFGSEGRKGLAIAGAVGLLVLVGACDLARVDRLYCAPVDMTEARRQDASAQMTFLQKQDFANPQVAQMVQAKRIVSLARIPWNPDAYLVEVLTPRTKPVVLPPFKVDALGLSLGVLALAGMLVLLAYGVVICRAKRT